jgi:hypothetical protein
MRRALERCMMDLAVNLIDPRRREWAIAMRVEWASAEWEGTQSWRFAWGCLACALRELPGHEAGRFGLARYFLALGVLVPMAVLLLASVAQGSAYWLADAAGAGALLGSGRLASGLNAANLSGWLLMAGLTAAMGLGHLALAWAVLAGRWRQVAALARMGVAFTATLVMFTSILFLGDFCALPQAFAIGVEAICVALMLQWQGELARDVQSSRT